MFKILAKKQTLCFHPDYKYFFNYINNELVNYFHLPE